MITYRQLEAFKAVIDAGTVIGGGEKMGLSQPAVSRLLADLEAAVGFPLFDRRRGRLKPRPEALQLYVEVDRAFVGLGRIAEAAKRIGRKNATHLRFVTCPGLAAGALAGVLAHFMKAHPKAILSLEVGARAQLLDGLARDLHDIGLGCLPIDRADVGVRRFMSTEFMCLVPAGHPLCGREVITPQDLHGVGCIMRTDGSPTRRTFDRVFNDAGVRPDIRFEVTTAQAAIALVAEGFGVSVGLKKIHDFTVTAGVRAIPFRPQIKADLAVLFPAGRPPAGIAADLVEAYAEAARIWQLTAL